MRITNSMVSQSMLYNINKNLKNMDNIYNQMASGKAIQVPSDDPVCTANVLKYKTYVSQIEQYQKNVGNALSWMNISEQSLNDIEDIMQRTRELTVQASNDTLSEIDSQMIKAEITQLKNSIIEIGNKTYAGRYIFTGYDTDMPPFELECTDAGEMITYKGEYLNVNGPFSSALSDEECTKFYYDNLSKMYEESQSEEIMYNISASSQVKVNVEGIDIFGQGLDGLFETFKKLEMALDGRSTYKMITVDENPPYEVIVQEEELDISSLLQDIDKNLDNILTVRADLGARINYVELSEKRLNNEYIVYTELLSKNEDVDMAKVAMDLANAQYIYQASLSAGSKVILPSLLDFIK